MVFVQYAVFTDLGIVYVLSIAVTSDVSELEIFLGIIYFGCYMHNHERLMTLLKHHRTVRAFQINHKVRFHHQH